MENITQTRISSIFKAFGTKFNLFFDKNEYDLYAQAVCDTCYSVNDYDEYNEIKHLEKISRLMNNENYFVVENIEDGSFIEVKVLENDSFYFNGNYYDLSAPRAA